MAKAIFMWHQNNSHHITQIIVGQNGYGILSYGMRTFAQELGFLNAGFDPDNPGILNLF